MHKNKRIDTRFCKHNEKCYHPDCHRGYHTNGLNRKGLKWLKKRDKVWKQLEQDKNAIQYKRLNDQINHEAITSQLYKDKERLYKDKEILYNNLKRINIYNREIKSLNIEQKKKIDLHAKEVEHLNVIIDDCISDKKIKEQQCMICYRPVTENSVDTEEHECNCTMNVHKFCLEKFTILNQMSCIICRTKIEIIPPPPPPWEPIVYTGRSYEIPPPLDGIPPPPDGTPPPDEIPIIDLITPEPSDQDYPDYISLPDSIYEDVAVLPPNPPPTQFSSPRVRNNDRYYHRNVGIDLIRPVSYTPPTYVIQPPVSYIPYAGGPTDL